MEEAVRSRTDVLSEKEAGAVSSRATTRGRPAGPEISYAGKPVSEYENVDSWLNDPEAGFSESYKKQGRKYLAEFCNYVGKDPDCIIAERKARLRQDPDDRTDENNLKRWHLQLLKEDAPGYALAKYTSIVSFFRWNNKPLTIARFPRVRPEDRREFRRARKEEVQRLLSFANNHRDKLILLVGAESGLRARALRVMRLQNLVASEDGSKEGIVAKTWQDLAKAVTPCRVQLPKKFYFGRKKEGITFLCEDAVKNMVDWLKVREAAGEPMGPETPLFPTYLTRTRIAKSGTMTESYLSEYHKPGSQVSVRAQGGRNPGFEMVGGMVDSVKVDCIAEQTIEYIMRTLRAKAGINHNPEEERPLNIHSLRKYLRTSLDSAGVNAVLVNTIIGHSSAVEEHYSGRRHLQIEEIREAYKSAAHKIAITENDDGPQVLELQRRVKQLEAYTRIQEQQLSASYGPLRDELTELQRQFAEFLKSRTKKGS